MTRLGFLPVACLLFAAALASAQQPASGHSFHDRYAQLGGVQQDVGQLLAQMPTTSVQDYDNILARLNGVPALVDQAIVLLGKGLEAGITPPRVTLRDVPDQIRGITPDDPMASPLLQPFAQFPPAIPATERERLTRAARDAYTQRVAPAYRKLYDYFVGSYVPKTRESIGMRELADGAAWYAYRVRRFTTTTLSPDQIHALGLREVKRIRALMDSVIASTGFKGSFADFARFLRTDPQFFYDDSASLVRAYRDIAKRADPGLIKLFGKLPRLPYGVTTIPSFMAKSQTTAYYQGGSLQAGRPGYFFVNTYDLKSRPKWEMEALSLHEAVPGHHLQIALAQALAYKIGQLKFRELRDSTAAALGTRFDIRAYHDEALRNGALPLDLLEQDVREWIGKQR